MILNSMLISNSIKYQLSRQYEKLKKSDVFQIFKYINQHKIIPKTTLTHRIITTETELSKIEIKFINVK